MKRVWLWVVVVVLVLGAALGLWRFTVDHGLDKAAKLAKDVDVDVSMKGVELSQGHDGKIQWRLKAKGADYLQQGGIVRVDSPVVTYYGGVDGKESASGGKPVVVVAPKGEVRQQEEEVTLWPDVKVAMGQADLRSDKLVYKGKESRTIRMSGSVVMTQGRLSVKAPQVTYDLDKDIIFAWGGVEADIAPSSPASKGAAQ